ncbi:MAG: glycosyltransferase family 39 protein [Candidatus Levyibacteriota bacterium]|nr:MAG: glycosyltransferase family 39 protein [Candidatus Levybacteria bacterium]
MRYFLLVCIIILAIFLRFFQLGQNPSSLTWDEVAWGYNAYTLGIDGRDEFGRFLPLDYLESFGDFKPPLYAYLVIIPVKIFGLNEFAVRFPSAFFGVLTVFATYFLTKELFNKSPYSLKIRNLKLEISEVAALLLAVSPWHVNLSRAAFEANISTFFIVVGVLFFLLWRNKNYGYALPTSIVSFVLSLYVFNTARVVSPLLFLVLAIVSLKQFWNRKIQVAIAVIVGGIILFPLLKFLFTPQASLRFQEVNIFSDIGIVQRANTYIENDGNTTISKIIHNRRWGYTIEFLRHYFDHFSARFLFLRGDGNPKFSTQDVGSMYLWDLPFFIIGVLFLFRYRPGHWWLVPVWLLIGIVPAATARETPHALRIETTLPTFQIFVAFGIVIFYQWIFSIKNRLKRRTVINVSIALLFLQILYYLHGYYIHYPREYSGQWQYGYKEAIAYIQNVEKNYDAIYFTDSLGRPHIYYAFYAKIYPSLYRKDAVVWREMPYGFVHVDKIGKVYFMRDLIPKDTKKRNLYIDDPRNVPSDAKILKNFKLLNGEDSLIAYTK